MRKNKSLISLLLCFAIVCSSLTAFAVADASKQIKVYSIDAYRDADDIVVDFSISANGIMDEIGAESITIYRKVGTHWTFEAEATRDDVGMTKVNRGSYSNIITYPADDGLEYKVVVTVFAENSDGYDSRTKTFYV